MKVNGPTPAIVEIMFTRPGGKPRRIKINLRFTATWKLKAAIKGKGMDGCM
ncbi:MAG: hypothetical protein QXE22_05565 [Candidatus Bathyarchaeia archaeon]